MTGLNQRCLQVRNYGRLSTMIPMTYGDEIEGGAKPKRPPFRDGSRRSPLSDLAELPTQRTIARVRKFCGILIYANFGNERSRCTHLSASLFRLQPNTP